MIKYSPLGTCPHRLVAQDGALSRPKQRFEFAWGHNLLTNIFQSDYFSKQKAQIITWAFCYIFSNVDNLLNISDQDYGSCYL